MRGKKKNDNEPVTHKNLPDEVRAKIDGTKDEAALNEVIANSAKFHAEMLELKENDQHLKECRDSLKEAGEQYAEEAKVYRATIKYARAVAEGRGYKTGSNYKAS